MKLFCTYETKLYLDCFEKKEDFYTVSKSYSQKCSINRIMIKYITYR